MEEKELATLWRGRTVFAELLSSEEWFTVRIGQPTSFSYDPGDCSSRMPAEDVKPDHIIGE